MRTVTKTALRLVAAWFVASVLTLIAAMLLAPSAGATTGYGKITTEVTVDCGEVTIAFTNTTKHNYSADWRRPGDVGTPDEFSAIVVEEGPLVGQPLGNRYNKFPVPVGVSELKIELVEDEDVEYTEYRLARGPEQKVFLDWVRVDVETNCATDETTTTSPTTTTTVTTSSNDTSTTSPSTIDSTSTTSESSTSSTPVTYPSVTTTSAYYENCSAVIDAGKAPIASDVPGYRLGLDSDRDGIGCELEELVSDVANDRDLASTGASVGPLIGAGTLLLIGGGIVVAVAVRRRRSSETT